MVLKPTRWIRNPINFGAQQKKKMQVNGVHQIVKSLHTPNMVQKNHMNHMYDKVVQMDHHNIIDE